VALDLIAELERVLDALARAGVEHALCGGLALAVHGHGRATMGIDVLVPPTGVEAALAAARAAGFDIPARKMIFGLRTGEPREVRRMSKLDDATQELLSLDLLIVGPSLSDVWAARTSVRWRDREIPIVSRAGLVAMKRLAGRPQDLADIAALQGGGDGDDT
jgi:hypothetical protein